ncbi:MAG: nucleoside triphosphate pyrophosphohydrolase family protein [archaeon]
MDMNSYQQQAKSTAVYPALEYGFLYPALGLTGEVGEITNKLKKVIRDSRPQDESFRADMKSELGDVLWYIAVLASELGLDLEDIALSNLEKLQSRKQRGTILGSGDER